MAGIFNSAIFNNAIFNTDSPVPPTPDHGGGDDAPYSMDDIRRYKKYIEDLKEYRRLKREAENKPDSEEVVEEVTIYEQKNYDIDYTKLTTLRNIATEIRLVQIMLLKAQLEYDMWRRKEDDELALMLLI